MSNIFRGITIQVKVKLNCLILFMLVLSFPVATTKMLMKPTFPKKKSQIVQNKSGKNRLKRVLNNNLFFQLHHNIILGKHILHFYNLVKGPVFSFIKFIATFNKWAIDHLQKVVSAKDATRKSKTGLTNFRSVASLSKSYLWSELGSSKSKAQMRMCRRSEGLSQGFLTLDSKSDILMTFVI